MFEDFISRVDIQRKKKT